MKTCFDRKIALIADSYFRRPIQKQAQSHATKVLGFNTLRNPLLEETHGTG
ncbi:hypothetical protein [Hydrogenimonas sp.]